MSAVELGAHKARTIATFDRIAEVFDDGLNIWAEVGARTVDLNGVAAGHGVLDVCCGTGASVLPAARAASPGGRVVGVDLSEAMLRQASGKAREAGLGNVSFFRGDMTDLDVPAGWFDRVLCVFGVFFVPDVAGVVRELWRVTAPGGRLTITSWGALPFADAMDPFFDALRELRPDLPPNQPPWAGKTDTPAALAARFAEAGAAEPTVVVDTFTKPASAEAVWSAVTNSGMRAMLDALAPGEADALREASAARFARSGVTEASADVLYATAAKPG